MKFTIMGFSQKKLIELELDSIDALILRYFIDFKDSGSMVTKVIDNKSYYWFRYENLIKELPILKLKKDSIYRRLKKMTKVSILEHKTIKKGGVYSFYTIGKNYKKLIKKSYEPVGYKSEPIGNKSGTLRNEIRTLPDINPEPYGNKSGTNNSSIKDSSIKDSSIKEEESFPTPFHEKVFNNFEEITYKTWFANCKVVEDKEKIQIITSSKFITDVIVQKYKKALEVLTGKKIIVKE